MRRVILVSLVLALTTVAGASEAVYAQQRPEFKLGFKALADQIPDIVGDPLENEHWGDNGDSLQTTSNGLMVWRKADNWTAFTNGSRSWINGPAGVQDRPNDARFEWEGTSPPAASGDAPSSAPSATPTEVVLPRYSPEVKAMDEESGPIGVMIADFMRETDADFENSWGWKPSKPTTVYLFSDGYRMADMLATLRGTALSDSEKLAAPRWPSASLLMARDPAWSILVNVGFYGGGAGDIYLKAGILRHYARAMTVDLAGSRAPTWFREGFVELLTYTRMPEVATDDIRGRVVASYRNAGTLPTLRYMQDNFQSIAQSPDGALLTLGMSYLAVSFLSDQVGGQGLLDIQKRTAMGESFDAALQKVTGYTLDQLDVAYRVKIP